MKKENVNLFHLHNQFRPYLKNGSRHKCFIDAYNHFDQLNNLFKCYNGKKISFYLLNDLVTDCGPEAEDEFILKSLASNTYFLCSEKEQLPCIKGHNRCYYVSQICIYQLIFEQYLMPCRTGQHLYNCKAFECNSMFKCPNFYCIPWSYICDGKWDCPYGNDENISFCNQTILCLHKFKCRNSHTCIHFIDICNNETDCTHGDDELMCPLKDTECIQHCNCLGFTLRCISINDFEHKFIQNFYFTSLYIINCSDIFIRTILMKIKFTFILKLSKNKLTAVCIILPSLRKNLMVDLSFNLVREVTSGCFQHAPYLAEVKLNHNYLSVISYKAFHNLPSLSFLDLSYNKLKHVTFLLNLHLICYYLIFKKTISKIIIQI